MSLRVSLSIALVALATGCLGHNEKIRVRRDPPGPTVDERRAQAAAEDEARVRLSHEVRESESYMKESAKRIEHARATNRDPWAEMEKDRRRVILQPWGDTGKPPLPAAEETTARQEEEESAVPVVGGKKKPGDEAKPDEGGDKKPDEMKKDEGGEKKPDEGGGEKKGE